MICSICFNFDCDSVSKSESVSSSSSSVSISQAKSTKPVRILECEKCGIAVHSSCVGLCEEIAFDCAWMCPVCEHQSSEITSCLSSASSSSLSDTSMIRCMICSDRCCGSAGLACAKPVIAPPIPNSNHFGAAVEPRFAHVHCAESFAECGYINPLTKSAITGVELLHLDNEDDSKQDSDSTTMSMQPGYNEKCCFCESEAWSKKGDPMMTILKGPKVKCLADCCDVWMHPRCALKQFVLTGRRYFRDIHEVLNNQHHSPQPCEFTEETMESSDLSFANGSSLRFAMLCPDHHRLMPNNLIKGDKRLWKIRHLARQQLNDEELDCDTKNTRSARNSRHRGRPRKKGAMSHSSTTTSHSPTVDPSVKKSRHKKKKKHSLDDNDDNSGANLSSVPVDPAFIIPLLPQSLALNHPHPNHDAECLEDTRVGLMFRNRQRKRQRDGRIRFESLMQFSVNERSTRKRRRKTKTDYGSQASSVVAGGRPSSEDIRDCRIPNDQSSDSQSVSSRTPTQSTGPSKCAMSADTPLKLAQKKQIRAHPPAVDSLASFGSFSSMSKLMVASQMRSTPVLSEEDAKLVSPLPWDGNDIGIDDSGMNREDNKIDGPGSPQMAIRRLRKMWRKTDQYFRPITIDDYVRTMPPDFRYDPSFRAPLMGYSNLLHKLPLDLPITKLDFGSNLTGLPHSLADSSRVPLIAQRINGPCQTGLDWPDHCSDPVWDGNPDHYDCDLDQFGWQWVLKPIEFPTRLECSCPCVQCTSLVIKQDSLREEVKMASHNIEQFMSHLWKQSNVLQSSDADSLCDSTISSESKSTVSSSADSASDLRPSDPRLIWKHGLPIEKRRIPVRIRTRFGSVLTHYSVCKEDESDDDDEKRTKKRKPIPMGDDPTTEMVRLINGREDGKSPSTNPYLDLPLSDHLNEKISKHMDEKREEKSDNDDYSGLTEECKIKLKLEGFIRLVHEVSDDWTGIAKMLFGFQTELEHCIHDSERIKHMIRTRLRSKVELPEMVQYRKRFHPQLLWHFLRHLKVWQNVRYYLSQGMNDTNPAVNNELVKLIQSQMKYHDYTSGVDSDESKKECGSPHYGAVCGVCFDARSSDDNPIIFCDGCNIGLHCCCYGVPGLHHSTALDDQQWLCDVCLHNQDHGFVFVSNEDTPAPDPPPPCYLCSIRHPGLAMRKIGDDSDESITNEKDSLFVHLTCALWTDASHSSIGLCIQDLSTMSIGVMNEPVITRDHPKCAICEQSSGVMSRCHAQLSSDLTCQCGIHAHPLCAWLAGWKIIINNDKVSGQMTCELFCEDHSNIIRNSKMVKLSDIAQSRMSVLLSSSLSSKKNRLDDTSSSSQLIMTSSNTQSSFVKPSTLFENEHCRVCFQPITKHSSAYTLRCKMCKIVVHNGCYLGYSACAKDVFLSGNDDNKNKWSDWKCDLCLRKRKKKSDVIECEICHSSNKQAAFKATAVSSVGCSSVIPKTTTLKSKFVHLCCALWYPSSQLSLVNPQTNALLFESHPPIKGLKMRFGVKCAICGTHDHLDSPMIKCDANRLDDQCQCSLFVHPLCALISTLDWNENNNDDGSDMNIAYFLQWNHRFEDRICLCPNHRGLMKKHSSLMSMRTVKMMIPDRMYTAKWWNRRRKTTAKLSGHTSSSSSAMMIRGRASKRKLRESQKSDEMKKEESVMMKTRNDHSMMGSTMRISSTELTHPCHQISALDALADIAVMQLDHGNKT